jgi:peptide/nickel transport system permease protein
VLQAVTLLFAVTYVTLNLIADVVAIVRNPKLLHAH